jgi:glycosyltransferase involved in cell wall biosynthesis
LVKNKKRVLIVHPRVAAAGGGNAVAAWTLQALRGSCELSLATLAEVDYESVNRSFGTSLRPGDFEVFLPPARYHRLLRWVPINGALLGLCVLMRFAQDLARSREFELLFGTQNEADFGRKGLQYVHYPWAYFPRPEVEMQWFHKIPGFLNGYVAACSRLARSSNAGLRRNITLANSEFTASRIRAAHQIDSTILYPPVVGQFPRVAWGARKLGFVGVGRMHPAKRWHMAIAIIDEVRRRGHAVTLTLIGHADDSEYAREIESLAQSRHWLRLLSDLSREELAAEVAGHRYGIHTMEEEHFGIAPAELQRAGCIVFVHNSGGPIEIVGHDSRVLFDSVDEAAGKMVRVIEDEMLSAELLNAGASLAERFTSERFCESIRQVVHDVRVE